MQRIGAIEEIFEVRDPGLEEAVSVVIPAFNEGPHVAEQVEAVREALERTGWRWEIVVVDDGSSDGTAEAAAAAGVRVVRHRRNRGYGAALKTGVAATRMPWVLITDADGTYPADAIPALLARADGADMAVGARVGKTVRIETARRPAKWFLRVLAGYLADQPIPDLNSGLRLMRRSLIEQYLYVLPSGFSFTTTITLASLCNEHPVEWVPIDYHRRLGSSKIRPRHAYDFALLIIRTICFFNPLKVFIPLGMLLMLAGVAKGVYDVVIGNLSESAVLGLLGALMVWSVGLLADQNARLAARR